MDAEGSTAEPDPRVGEPDTRPRPDAGARVHVGRGTLGDDLGGTADGSLSAWHAALCGARTRGTRLGHAFVTVSECARSAATSVRASAVVEGLHSLHRADPSRSLQHRAVMLPSLSPRHDSMPGSPIQHPCDGGGRLHLVPVGSHLLEQLGRQVLPLIH
eukprot:scaffold2803_cov347-Prasinococcus_capsulatus_cf.AAC.14